MDHEYILLVRVIVPPLHNGCCSGKHEMTTSRITMTPTVIYIFVSVSNTFFTGVITAGNNNTY
jgi:hypothetical protein